jgi:TonB family protein
MRKNALRITVGAVLCVGISAAWLTANGQVSAPPSRSLPKNPLDFLKAAAQVNGLETDEIGPWHLKATFTLFDALGNPTDHGSYEVLWVNHHQGKGSVESAGFSQVWISHGRKDVTVSGSRGLWPDLLSKMSVGFIHPVHEIEDHRLQFAFEKPGAENQSVQCVSSVLSDAGSALENAMSNSTLCFDAAEPVLLVRIDAFGIKTVRENIFRFHGRYVARDLTVNRSGRVYLKAHLESLEELNPIDQTEFVPPLKAFEQLPFILLYKKAADARLLQIRKVEPDYPVGALATRVSGVVNVKTTIDVGGHVSDAIALDGPPLLQEAALNAVRQYLFKPVSENNYRCVIETVFPVEFKLPVTK